MFIGRAVTHNFFNAGPVIPRAIKESDLSAAGQMPHISLKIPLAYFTFRRSGKGNNLSKSGVEVLGEPLDC